MSSILQNFCADSLDPRHYLRSPMRSKHGACACNGHIMVCLPQDDGDYPATQDGIEQSFDKFAQLEMANSIPVADLVLPEKIACWVCGGKGHRHVAECKDCDGEGVFGYGSHTYECKECGGDGKMAVGKNNPSAEQIPCSNCQGNGETWTDMPVGNADFSTPYIHMIAALPNARIKPDGMAPAKFTFDGGWGALMPCHPRKTA